MSYTYDFQLRSVPLSLISHTFVSKDLAFLEDSNDDAPPSYTFSSHHLDKLTDPIKIWSRGQFFLSIFKGAHVSLCDPIEDFYPAKDLILTNLYKGQTNLTPSEIHKIIQQRGYDPDIESLSPSLQLFEENNPLGKLIALARNNQDIESILLQVGNGIDWINLYAILDTLKFYSSNVQKYDAMLANAGITIADVKAFTGTVNNFGLLSVEARHGELGYGTPQRHVSLEEARKMILGMCRSYYYIVHNL